MLNPEMFERFAWKYMEEIGNLVLDAGVIPLFHLDSNWDLGLHYFKRFPRGKCILELYGQTDIFRAKEIIGDHCCLMGDVPATMTAFGKVDDVKDYCAKLIREVGPKGFILSSGCDAPYNAKLENMQAMAHSVFEK
jgi:uroporphyrinogen-III decarboxylase